MDPQLRAAAEAARGFMPPDEGLALHDAAAAVTVDGPFLEVGSYCGKSSVYLGAAAAARGTVLFALDHHRGSEENQPGWEFHEPDLVDPDVGRIDTLPRFRRTVHDAGLEPHVVAVVGDSPTVGRYWTTPLAFLFIDGGHGREPAHADFDRWVPHVRARRHPGHPRRVPRPGRRRPTALRAVPARPRRRVRTRLGHRLAAHPPPPHLLKISFLRHSCGDEETRFHASEGSCSGSSGRTSSWSTNRADPRPVPLNASAASTTAAAE